VNISGSTLLDEYRRAKQAWPFIEAVEKAHGLPSLLLYAVGSRETNLQNEHGDLTQRKGESSPRFHGFGVWQRDSDAFPGTDESYLKDVHRQAEDAATLLAANHRTFGRWDAAVAAYNCGVGDVKAALAAGRSIDHSTTGGDYAADVLARHAHLVAHVRGGTTPVTGAVVTGSGHTCTVRPGDTLSAIAASHHTTVAALASLNHISNPNLINVGQVLRLS